MRKPNIHNIAAWLALFFSLAGTGLAASHYVITSTSQIKPSVRRALHGARGPAGSQGVQGPQGTPGPTVLGHLVRVMGPKTFVGAFGVGSSTATCPAGEDVVSGGYLMVGAVAHVFIEDTPSSQTWTTAIGVPGEETANVEAVAFCAPAGQAVTASLHSNSQRIRAAMAAETLRLRSSQATRK
jgi:hypothetical protein